MNHICDMGERDSGYANYAIEQYLSIDHCPFPEIKEAVKNEVKRRKAG